jgi:hypothetical protein
LGPRPSRYTTLILSALSVSTTYFANYRKANPGLTKLFVIKADLSKLEDKLVEMEDDDDETYYQLDFGVEIVFDSINFEGNVVYGVRTLIPFFIIPLTSVFLRKQNTAARPKNSSTSKTYISLPLTKIVDIYSPTHDINYLFDV